MVNEGPARNVTETDALENEDVEARRHREIWRERGVQRAFPNFAHSSPKITRKLRIFRKSVSSCSKKVVNAVITDHVICRWPREGLANRTSTKSSM